MRHWFAFVALAPLLGCSAIAAVEGGASYAVGKPRQSAFALNAYAGIGDTDGHAGAGGGAMLRAKVGPHMGQIALGPMFFFLGGPAYDTWNGVTPRAFFFSTGGFNAVQLESIEGRFAFGAFSPHAQAGVFLRTFDQSGFFLSVGGEYDVRFADLPNTGYASFFLGFGDAAYSIGPPPGAFRGLGGD